MIVCCMALPMRMLFVCLQYIHSQGSMNMMHGALPVMLCSGPKLTMTRCTAIVAQRYLQTALLLMCELSVLHSHLVERMIVLSVMTLIKNLQSQTLVRLRVKKGKACGLQ